MAIVYRIEHSKETNGFTEHRIGVFNSRYYYSLPTDMRLKISQISPPSPSWFNYDSNYIFAFSSVKSLLKYFDKEICEAIQALGFVIAKYETEAVLEDNENEQCAFHKDKARLIDTCINYMELEALAA